MLCLISLIEIIIIIINIEINYLFPFSNLFIKFITFFAVIAKKFLLLYYKCIVFFSILSEVYTVFCLAGRSNWRKTRTCWDMRSSEMGNSTSGCRSGTDGDQRQQNITIALQCNNN